MDGTGVAILIVGLAATVAAMAGPLAYPKAPIWVWRVLFWLGIAGMFAAIGYLLMVGFGWKALYATAIAGGAILIAYGIIGFLGASQTAVANGGAKLLSKSAPGSSAFSHPAPSDVHADEGIPIPIPRPYHQVEAEDSIHETPKTAPPTKPSSQGPVIVDAVSIGSLTIKNSSFTGFTGVFRGGRADTIDIENTEMRDKAPDANLPAPPAELAALSVADLKDKILEYCQTILDREAPFDARIAAARKKSDDAFQLMRDQKMHREPITVDYRVVSSQVSDETSNITQEDNEDFARTDLQQALLLTSAIIGKIGPFRLPPRAELPPAVAGMDVMQGADTVASKRSAGPQPRKAVVAFLKFIVETKLH